MLDWLTDPTTMEISDQIEKVNKKMFEKLIARNEFLTVFFCKFFSRNSSLFRMSSLLMKQFTAALAVHVVRRILRDVVLHSHI
jgi:hypothetical protein